MKKIVGWLKEYSNGINKKVFITCTLFTAIAVFCNYNFYINRFIYRLPGAWPYAGWYFVFLMAFGAGYISLQYFTKKKFWKDKKFLILLLLAPAIFAWKMAADIDYHFSADFFKDRYWDAVVYWPFKVAVITALLYLTHRIFSEGQTFYGTTTKGFQAKPYFIMLLIMLPLVAAASTQKDFLSMYPRMQNIEYLLQPDKGLHKLLYQLSYGSDFFSIELFFRGFLVLAFAKWVGKDAILPMAIFYCTIHFGKPLGECISSYFGGMILGVVAFHTQSIFGGFIVHVGIAWLMELGGYIGHQYF